jgi:hypothetical protein
MTNGLRRRRNNLAAALATARDPSARATILGRAPRKLSHHARTTARSQRAFIVGWGSDADYR